MSAAGLVFKGTGFYITDYGKDGKKPQQTTPAETKPEKPAESGAAAPAAESKPAVSDTKPAAPPKKAE